MHLFGPVCWTHGLADRLLPKQKCHRVCLQGIAGHIKALLIRDYGGLHTVDGSEILPNQLRERYIVEIPWTFKNDGFLAPSQVVGNGISESSNRNPEPIPLLKVLPPPGVPPSPVATPAIPRWFVDRIVSPRGKPRGKTLSSVSVLKGHQHININQKTCFLKEIIYMLIFCLVFVRCCCVFFFVCWHFVV